MPILAQLKEATIQSQVNSVSDLLPRQKELRGMETLNPERLQLLKENNDTQKNYEVLSRSLRNMDEYYNYLQDNEVTTEEMTLLLEQYEEKRETDEIESIKRLKEETMDDDY